MATNQCMPTASSVSEATVATIGLPSILLFLTSVTAIYMIKNRDEKKTIVFSGCKIKNYCLKKKRKKEIVIINKGSSHEMAEGAREMHAPCSHQMSEGHGRYMRHVAIKWQRGKELPIQLICLNESGNKDFGGLYGAIAEGFFLYEDS